MIGLQWVLVDDKLAHVSQFAKIPPKKRPDAYCPLCRTQVDMKLGDINMHHVAHRPFVKCVVISHPEKVFHLNVELHIIDQLSKHNKLSVYVPCFSTFSCKGIGTAVWASGWDDLIRDTTFKHIHLDVGLLKRNNLMAIIDVDIAGEDKKTKGERLAQLDVDWMIVDAEAIYGDPYRIWTADKPIPLLASNTLEDFWVCDDCKTLEKERRLRRPLELKLYSLNSQGIVLSRWVDAYYEKGKKERIWYFICEETNPVSGGSCSFLMTNNGKVLEYIESHLNEDTKQKLHETFKAHLRSLHAQLIDYVFMPHWNSWHHVPYLQEKVLNRYLYNEFRYYWLKREWVKGRPEPVPPKPVPPPEGDPIFSKKQYESRAALDNQETLEVLRELAKLPEWFDNEELQDIPLNVYTRLVVRKYIKRERNAEGVLMVSLTEKAHRVITNSGKDI